MKINFQKTALAVGISAAFLGGASVATAQDWSGAYIGATLGQGSLSGEATTDYGSISQTEEGIVYSINGGYNWQNGTSVYGVEVDFNAGNLNEETPDIYGSYYKQTAEWEWYSSIRGRLGLAVDNTLLYVTGGLAIVDVDYQYCYNSNCSASSDDAESNSGTENGLTYGVGVEMALDKNLHVKAEFNHVELSSTQTNDEGGDPVDFESDLDTVRIGVNLLF